MSRQTHRDDFPGTRFGWLLRSTAGALSALVVVLTVVPTLGLPLPDSIAEKVPPYLPDNAGQALMATTASDGQLGPWAGLVVFVAWILITPDQRCPGGAAP